MNRFDKETTIIDAFQNLKKKDIFFANSALSTRKVFNSIYDRRKWSKWIDSSSKKDLPPDFYNDKMKLMMDVMRIDDHAFEDLNGKIINPTNKRESELLKILASKSESLRKAVTEGRVIIIPDSGLRGKKDHNYTFYYKNFERVVTKHLDKINNYKNNHPKYKTIFFILDESSPYFTTKNNYKPCIPGEIVYSIFHQWWKDYNMLKNVYDSELDYIIWFSPYKHFDSLEKFEPPYAVVIDVKKIKIEKTINYIARDMYSAEI